MLVRARARGTHVHLCLNQALAVNWESSRPYTLASTDPTAPPTCYLRPPEPHKDRCVLLQPRGLREKTQARKGGHRMGGVRRMMEFLQHGYPYFPATVATLNLSRPDLGGLKGKEIASGKHWALGNLGGCHRLLRLGRLGLGSKTRF